jgi:hypothetical protein
MPSQSTLKLCVAGAAYLPTVLTAVALRIKSFAVIDDRNGAEKGWLVMIPAAPTDAVCALLDVLPVHMCHVLEGAQLPQVQP